jgi:glycosyltransferase involved in cell wall biosynthesis
VVSFLDGRGEGYEVLVVDDGSRDGTAERVGDFHCS